MGIHEQIIEREIEYLAKAFCILSEDFRTESLTDNDLVRLAPAGFVHLDLIGNVTYLAAAAEDTLFDDEGVALRIARRISQIRQVQIELTDTYMDTSAYKIFTNIDEADQAIARLQNNVISGPWIEASSKLLAGAEADGIIVNQKDYGIFVEITDFSVTGLIHKSRLPRNFETNEIFLPGETIKVKIRDLDPIRQRMGLEYVPDSLL